MAPLRGGRPGALAAVALVAMMVATTLPLQSAAAAPTPAAGQWGETWLYLRSSGDLSPAPPGAAEFPSNTPFTTNSWTMGDGLHKGLCVEAGDQGSGATGFALDLNLTAAYLQGAWTVFVQLLDEDTIIAQEMREFTSGANPGPQSDWTLAFTSNRTSCQVLTGHHLQVSVTSTKTVQTTGRGAHVVLWAQDAIAPTVATENADGPTDLFYPNDLDGSRSVFVKGVLNNAFAASLVSSVNIAVTGLTGGAIANGTATVQDDNFTYTWSYAPGISGGLYTITAQVEDLQGNTFNATATVTMAAYGLRITTPDQVNQSVTGYAVPGDSARYDLTVTNIGGQPTTVLMVTENPPPTGWTVSFSSDQFGLSAGGSNVTVFRATPGPSIQPGQSAQTTVVAQARDDPASVKARGTMLTTTVVIKEAALSIDPPSTDATIRLGQFVLYDFTLTNNGGLATDVTLDVTDAPEGWSREVTGTSVVPDGNGWKVIALPAGAERTLTLNVTAPADSTSTSEFACTVTARPVGNASVVATFVATTQLLLGIELSQASPTGVPSVPPGQSVEFQVDVVNTDPLSSHTITQAGTSAIPSPNNPAPVTGGGAMTVDVVAPADGTCCAPHSSATISVIVHTPGRALPGRYTFELSTVVDGVSSQTAMLNLSLDIDRVTAISLTVGDSAGPLTVGQSPVSFDLTVSNDGNVLVVVDLSAQILGSRVNEDWKVKFLDQGGSEIDRNRISLGAYSTTVVTVQLEAPTTTFNGDERQVTVSANQVGGEATATLDTPIDVTVSLPPMDRFIRLLTAQYIIVFLMGFVLWGLITAGWGRTIWRRTHGAEVASDRAAAQESPARKPREVK